MKKILALSLTILLILSSLPGCGGGTSAKDSEDSGNSTAYTDDNSTGSNDADNSSDDTDDNNDTNDNNDSDSQQENNLPDADETWKSTSGSLLDDDTIYFFVMDGKKFKVGDKISDISVVGYQLANGDNNIEPKGSVSGGMVLPGDVTRQFFAAAYNPTDATIKSSDAVIGGFKLRAMSVTDEIAKNAEVYGGIRLGSSSEAVKEAFGEPTRVMDTTYIYRTEDTDRFFKFRFDENMNVDTIEWNNYTFDKDVQDDTDNKDDEKNSTVTSGRKDKSLLKPYLGMWKYENKAIFIALEADFTWSMYDSSTGERGKINSGTFTVDESRVYLCDKKDEFIMSMESITSNYLVDNEGEDIYRYISG